MFPFFKSHFMENTVFFLNKPKWMKSYCCYCYILAGYGSQDLDSHLVGGHDSQKSPSQSHGKPDFPP